jgi:hypothetical protein
MARIAGDAAMRVVQAGLDGEVALSRRVSATLTRPANVTAYAAGDAVTDTGGAGLTFSAVCPENGGQGVIRNVVLIDSAAQATKGQFELWLFAGTAIPTADVDNAVFTPTDAELLNLVGVVSLATSFVGDATVGAGGNCIFQSGAITLPFTCGASVDDLFGLVVVRNAYTPVSGETLTAILTITPW